jgi:hypothetical protein
MPTNDSQPPMLLTTKRGIFAHILHDDPEELASAIDITLQRFAEYHSLQGAFGRRAVMSRRRAS